MKEFDEVKLLDSAKNYLFDISFFDKDKGEWNNELRVRAKRIINEAFIHFDEFTDFYVSKFFDEHPDGFYCDIVIKFYDNEFNEVCYQKEFKNRWLYIEKINDLNQYDECKLFRIADIEYSKRRHF